MKEQDSLHDQMVIHYHKMMVKCKNYDENSERMKAENCQIKSIIQCLIHKSLKLFGCSSIKEHLFKRDDCKDEIQFLEVLEVSHRDVSILDFFKHI